eukprot:6096179-Amphidinium_carterae.1
MTHLQLAKGRQHSYKDATDCMMASGSELGHARYPISPTPEKLRPESQTSRMLPEWLILFGKEQQDEQCDLQDSSTCSPPGTGRPGGNPGGGPPSSAGIPSPHALSGTSRCVLKRWIIMAEMTHSSWSSCTIQLSLCQQKNQVNMRPLGPILVA